MAHFIAQNALDAMKNVGAELRASQQDLVVRSHKMVIKKEIVKEKEQNKKFIVGSCVNRSKTKTYLPAEVTFSLYDGNGIVIGLAVAQTTDPLRPGATWKFKAPVENSAAATCQVQGAAGYPSSILLEKAATNVDPASQSRTEFLLNTLDDFCRRAIQDPKLRKAL
jgi:hypothetical protein